MTKAEKLKMAKELIIADLQDNIEDVKTGSNDDPEEISFIKALKIDISTVLGIQEDQIPNAVNRVGTIEFIQQIILKYPIERF